MNALQTAVSVVVNLLVEGDFETIEKMTGGRRLSASELEAAVSEYGRTLVGLPPEALDELDVVEIENSDPTVYSVTADLYTEEEGKSDLSLELRLTDVYDGAYETEVMDLRVL